MFDPKLYREACRELRAPEDKIEEIIAMTEKTNKRRVRPLRAALIAAAAVAMMVVGGIHWGWIAAGVGGLLGGGYLLLFTDLMEKIGYNAGYSFHGRMLALGQVEGMMTVVRNDFQNK